MKTSNTVLIAAALVLSAIAAGNPHAASRHATHARSHAVSRGAHSRRAVVTHAVHARPAPMHAAHAYRAVEHPARARSTVTRPRAVPMRVYRRSHTHTVSRFTRERRAGAVVRIAPARLESESSARFESIGRRPTRLGHVTVRRAELERLRASHAPLRNAVFVTGTVVSRAPTRIVVRTTGGETVDVVPQSVYVSPSVLVPGSAVVLPVQYVNGGYVLMPAFSQSDQQAFAAPGPVLAPCAINDHDADDAGDTGYYAPANACLTNDGDADDGYGAFNAPPSGFPSMPQVFSASYAPVVAGGFVVAHAGSNVVLMTPNFTPLVVNASAASVNGPLTIGRYVTVYGYDVNNNLVATSLM